MQQLPWEFLLAALIWALGALALYLLMRRLPKYRYEALLRSEGAGDPPAYRSWYWVPLPEYLIKGLCSAAFIFYGLHALRDVSVFISMREGLLKLLMWLNGAQPASLPVVHLELLWLIAVPCVACFAVFCTASIAAREVAARFFPHYVAFKARELPGWWTKRLDEELAREKGEPKSRARLYVVLIMLALFVAGYRGLSLIWGVTGLVAIGSQAQRRQRELQQHFDPARVDIVFRRSELRYAFCAWLVTPAVVLGLAYLLPFYTVDESGIREYWRLKQRFVSWDSTSSLQVTVRRSPSLAILSGPDVETILPIANERFDLNLTGAMTLNPANLKTLIETIKKTGLPINCSLEPQAEDQLRERLAETSSGVFAVLHRQALALIRETCRRR